MKWALLLTHFTEEDSQAKKSHINCPKSHNQEVVEPGCKPKQSGSRAWRGHVGSAIFPREDQVQGWNAPVSSSAPVRKISKGSKQESTS